MLPRLKRNNNDKRNDRHKLPRRRRGLDLLDKRRPHPLPNGWGDSGRGGTVAEHTLFVYQIMYLFFIEKSNFNPSEHFLRLFIQSHTGERYD